MANLDFTLDFTSSICCSPFSECEGTHCSLLADIVDIAPIKVQVETPTTISGFKEGGGHFLQEVGPQGIEV
jgi:hypothetical protein